MTLAQFLSTFTFTKDTDVTLLDLETSKEIATLKVAGYESLDNAIEARTVAQWSIVSPTHIKVVLASA